MKNRRHIFLFHTAVFLLLGAFSFGPSSLVAFASQENEDMDRVRQEESENYYEKWLKEDVIWVITGDEKSVFEGLTTDEEREMFIEQFWLRRDPDPRTSNNEFKEEHYRRIAYVNERYGSGLPGWRTDRGKTYIIHGPPDEIDPHPTGGPYDRMPWEGGGQTVTFPFEVWRYRHLEGIGSDIMLEFVDRSYTGEYKLALEPEEKDALLYVGELGPTDAERWGMASKSQRRFFDPSSDYPEYRRLRDGPFDRFMVWNRIHHPPALKYPELREVVEVNLSFGRLPFEVQVDYFRLSEDQTLAAISMEAQNKDLSFVEEGGFQVARVAVYGIVTGMTREIVTEFDDDMENRVPISNFDSALASHSLYQKIITLESKKRYKLTFVTKDLNTNKVGVLTEAILPPIFGDEKLASSSLMLSDSYEAGTNWTMSEQMFVIGDVWIHPNLGKVFKNDKAMGAFFHVYNMALDQTRLEPSLQAKYEILSAGKTVLKLVEHNNESLHFFSEGRTVFVKSLPIQRLGPGKYQIRIEVRDQIKNEVTTLEDHFEIADIPGTGLQVANRP
ncbi:MAG: GWxTD domain-containing protein [Acidobacteriota bacterium]|nr:MAG: GWxTD domain-containing protein [Acidobacteriota bacterium]